MFGLGNVHRFGHFPTYLKSLVVGKNYTGSCETKANAASKDALCGGAREATWPALVTAMDPRALSYSQGDYLGLGFLATANASAHGLNISITLAMKSATIYKLALYFVDFESDKCSCAKPPYCCKATPRPAASCTGGDGQRMQVKNT